MTNKGFILSTMLLLIAKYLTFIFTDRERRQKALGRFSDLEPNKYSNHPVPSVKFGLSSPSLYVHLSKENICPVLCILVIYTLFKAPRE